MTDGLLSTITAFTSAPTIAAFNGSALAACVQISTISCGVMTRLFVQAD